MLSEMKKINIHHRCHRPCVYRFVQINRISVAFYYKCVVFWKKTRVKKENRATLNKTTVRKKTCSCDTKKSYEKRYRAKRSRNAYYSYYAVSNISNW